MSCLAKFEWATIRISTEEPDFSSMPTTKCDCEESVYGKVKKLTPHDAPAPVGNHVVTISYHYSNFLQYHTWEISHRIVSCAA